MRLIPKYQYPWGLLNLIEQNQFKPTKQNINKKYKQEADQFINSQHPDIKKNIDKQVSDYTTQSNDNTKVNSVQHRQYNQNLKQKTIAGAKSNALWEKEHPTLSTLGYAAAAAPFIVASAPAWIPAGDAVTGTTVGHGISSVLANPYFNAAITASGGADAANKIYHGEYGKSPVQDAFTVLEMVPFANQALKFSNGYDPISSYIKGNYRFLKDHGELDADLYALKNMGYIKDGKISDEASKWLQVRHNLSPEGLKSSLEDLDAIGYAQPLSLKNPQQLTSHLQGNKAVKMFKEYGGIEIPKESKLGDQLRQYVYQARKQYGLLGNKDISDEEIAQSLYKEMMQNKSGAITDSGEPMIGFRGDTKQYSELIPRKTAEQYEKTPSGSADNVLGTLFLGEYPNKDLGLGSERYLNGYTPTSSESYLHPTPNSTYVKASPEEGLIKWDTNDPHYYIRNNQLLSLIKNEKVADGHWVGSRFIPNDGNVNDINAFMFKSNGVLDKTGKINPETRSTSEAYRYQDMVNEANKKNIGLIKSDPNEILEHENYTYIALPNFNLMGAKHILPYDLRIPRNWKDPNIYRSLLPVGIGGATSLYKKKQGGKLIPKGSYISK